MAFFLVTEINGKMFFIFGVSFLSDVYKDNFDPGLFLFYIRFV